MRLTYGFGINDANYVVRPDVNGRQVTCPAYRAWRDMIKRCYSAKLHAMFPTYVDVNVCKEWKSFMAFRAWWIDHHVDGYQLDKDLIGDGKLYSPETCIYVPQWLNNFTIDSRASRGDFPIGVSYDKRSGKYVARCSNPFGKIERLGFFDCQDQAHMAWLSRKLEIAAELKPMMDEIDERIYQKVAEIIKNAK